MSSQRQQNVKLAAGFIDNVAPELHAAFGTSSKLNMSTMQYEREEVCNLRETLECHHRKGGRYADFTADLTSCTWDDVHRELQKAQAAAVESERRGKNPAKKAWRVIGATSSVLAPGLAALPEQLCVLNGGLALIFSLARHSEMNRLKILGSFERVPNIIEMARNKTKNFPLDTSNQASIQLHQHIQRLQETLLRILPSLIEKLVPGTFRNWFNSPFRAWMIDQFLEEVYNCAESVRESVAGLVEQLIVGSYSASMTIQSQLDEVLREQREIRMSIDAAHGKTHLLGFLMDQLNVHAMGGLTGRDQADYSERGTALPGYTPEDLLRIIDVNHLRISHDAMFIVRRKHAISQDDIATAAHMFMAPQVLELVNSPSPGVVAIDGHFDRTQMGKISPLSYVCTLFAQALRQQSQQPQDNAAGSPNPNNMSPQFDKTASRSPSMSAPSIRPVVLEYFCALHTADDDDLRGPRGLIRGLTAQLLLALVANGWVGDADPLVLPHLQDGDEEELQLAQRDHGALCRLFAALVRLVPPGTPVYCLVDGWSSFEHDELWWADCEDVLYCAFQGAAASAHDDEGGAAFKLILTSPSVCRKLGDFVMEGQRVSLRNRSGGGKDTWRGASRGGLMGLARAATMPDAIYGLGGGYSTGEPGRAWRTDGYDPRSST